ncbi:efflux transporter outer membrane subunit [Henriciella aquimarina]|uniref:efflux transporter outer membrane subunit n=1 Tax=Henriciella aquimarina TaxID=545261 RepID=UPI001301BB93|nr:efflux transporter outer membrane subunit [Henriciella aquimarina]
MRPLLFATLAAGLAACTTVGPDFRAPDAPAAKGYSMSGDSPLPEEVRLVADETVPAEWWTVFGSPALDTLIEQGLANNPTLAAADASLAQARAYELSERGTQEAQASLQAMAERQRVNTASFGIEGFPSPTINLYSIGANVSYDLDLFGGKARQIENLSAQTEAQRLRRDAAYLSLTGALTLKAMKLASLNSQINELQAIIEADRQTLDMIGRAIAAGGEPEAARVTAQAQLAEDQAKLPRLRKRRAAARHALALLTGHLPGEWAAPEFTIDDFALPEDIPLSLPSSLVHNRPDILAAEAELHAAVARIGVTMARQYPNISLDASFAFAALKPGEVFNYESLGWAVGPSVTAPLLDGGSLKANEIAARAAAEEADARYRQTVLEAFVQIADVLEGLTQDKALIAAQTDAIRAAEENARLSSLAYENGAGSLLSLLDAQRQAQRVRLGAVEAKAQLRADIAELYAATASQLVGMQPAAF